MKKTALLALVLTLLAASPALARPEKYVFDPTHTQIIFSVSHLGISHPHGRFNKFSGGFTFDRENPEASQADIAIETGSIDMASDAWNTHMKKPDFFNVEKFPAMTFKSAKIEKTGEKTGTLTGDLTLLGVTKPVTLNVVFNGTAVHPMNKNEMAGFSATGTLKRSDFGMNYGLPMVGDDVHIAIEVEGIRQDFTRLPQ
jgi:polyisoprenoid-binding protein YceI